MVPSLRIVVAFHLAEALRDVLAGITLYAKEQHRHWQILCVTADEFEANFAGHRADGAIVLVRPGARRLIDRLRRADRPVVNIMRNLHPQLPSVLSDDHAIGRAAAEHLLSRGFRNMAFLRLDTCWSRDREAGFRAALEAAALSPPVTRDPLAVDDFRFTSHVRAAAILRRWVRSLPPRTAVFAPCDFAARTLLDAAMDEGIDVPRDLAILGVDNFHVVCELAPVPLSSIAQDWQSMGFQAAALLNDFMENRRHTVEAPILIPPGGMHVRASTDVLAFDDPIVVTALRAIHQQPATGISMRELLRQVPLSRKWLDQRFQRLVGHTPSEEIRRVRLNCVRDLLLGTSLPLRAIAVRCNFSCPENLSRAFKAAFGVSPQAYRERNSSSLVKK